MPQGAHGRMLIDTTATFDSDSIWVEFISESITEQVEYVNNAGIRGTRTHCSERTRSGSIKVTGQITFEASRILLDNILPAALGSAESSNVFNVAETLPDLYFLIDKRTDIIRINEAKIGKIRFEGSQGQVVQVTIDVEAESITTEQTWPSSIYPERSLPYMFSDLGDVTVKSSARKPTRVFAEVDNVLDGDTFLNSRTRDETIFATDRIVNCGIDVLASSGNKDLTAGTVVSGEAWTFVFTNAEEASSVLTIALGRVACPPAQPSIDGKGTKLLTLEGQSRGLKHPGESGAAADIAITNAHAT